MSKVLVLSKNEFTKLSSNAMWSKYRALVVAYEALSNKYERSLNIKGGLRGKVLYKSELIARFEEDRSAYRERQTASGSQSHARTNEMVADALIFWRINMVEGDALSHKRFQKMHRDVSPQSTLADDTYKKLKTAATKAWALYPSDVDMFIKAAKFFRNKPRGIFTPY